MNGLEPEKQLLTTREVSELLRVPLSTLYRITRDGRIKALKVGGQWRYPREEIEKYLSNGIDFAALPAYRNQEPKERRGYPRINCNLQCQYKVSISSLKDFSSYGSVRNISGSGVFLIDGFEKIKEVEVGDPIGLNISLLDDSGKTVNIGVQGRVVRKVTSGMGWEGVGIKFRGIPDDIRDKVVQYVG